MSADEPEPSRPIDRLLALMATLRDPVTGSPWDRAQTFASLAPYAIEEAHELAEAAERGTPEALKDELGDLLLQVIFHAQIAAESRLFDFDDIVRGLTEKLKRRHPLFQPGGGRNALRDHRRAWERSKTAERGRKDGQISRLMDGLPPGLPALTVARKLSDRAAAVGFVWPSLVEVFDKLDEEVGELRVEADRGDWTAAAEELGDVLFVCANIARELNADPEAALRGANAKFIRRFGHVEDRLREMGRSPSESDLPEMEGLWIEAKHGEKR